MKKYYQFGYFLLMLIITISFIGCTNQGLIKSDDYDPTKIDFVTDVVDMTISSVWDEGKRIPSDYTCNGDDVNPPLSIGNIPNGTESLVLIVDDPDSPNGMWVHWVMWNIPVVNEIAEDSVPVGAVQGINNFQQNNYGGPCPPLGTHRYYFKIYALNTVLDIPETSNKKQLEAKMAEFVIGKGEYMGTFSK